MPTNKYEKRTLVHVNPFTGSGIAFAFNSASSATQKTDLGQTDVNLAAPPAGLVIGANAPKPGRAAKKIPGGSVSSYFDIGKAGTLKAADWRIVSMPTIRRGKNQPLAKAVVITIGGIKYAWNMPNDTHAAIGADLGGLGIALADAKDKNLVWGATYPKLPRAQKFLSTGTGGGNIISTFVAPLKMDSLPAGWSASGKEYA